MRLMVLNLVVLFSFLVLVVDGSDRTKMRKRIRNSHRRTSNNFPRHRGRNTLALDLLDASPGKVSDSNVGLEEERKKGTDEEEYNDIILAQAKNPEEPSTKKKGSKSPDEDSFESDEFPEPDEDFTVDSEEIPMDSEEQLHTHSPTHRLPSTKSKGYITSSSKSSKKSKKRKSSADKKSSKKLKSSKSSSDSEEESFSPVAPPSATRAPVLPPSADPGTRPPTPVSEPTRAPIRSPSPNPNPSPTSSPVEDEGPTIRGLTPYGLDYTVTENRIPFRSEYLEVVELTRMYLAGYFDDQYEDSESTTLNEFLTIFTGSSFNFGQPVNIEYGSSAVFDSSSTVVPTVEMLDRILATAFRGDNLNGYIGMLQSLPPGNVFSTTIFVNQTEAGRMRVASAPKRAQTATVAAGTAAGAAGIMILAAGLLYYRRQQDEESGPTEKKLNSSMTVAGETYAGETFTGESFAGGWSVDQGSEAQPFRSGHSRGSSTLRDLPDDEEDEEDSVENSDEEPAEGDSEHRPNMKMHWENGHSKPFTRNPSTEHIKSPSRGLSGRSSLSARSGLARMPSGG